jgi:hypothetical protein
MVMGPVMRTGPMLRPGPVMPPAMPPAMHPAMLTGPMMSMAVRSVDRKHRGRSKS